MRSFLPALAVAGTLGVQAQKFDFVIAGAGTAGLVLAGRLSEDPKINVAVIEPGPDVRDNEDVQSLNFSFSNFNTSINWVYNTIPQPQLNGRTLSYRAGKAVGGTSIVNGWVYIRGDKAQYDAWETLGNPGWNWNTVFPYAKKGEDFEVPTPAQTAVLATYDPAAHGFSGPLAVSFPFDVSNSSYAAKASKTYASLGLAPIKDLNGGAMHGTSLAPLSVDRDGGGNGRRASSASAYYQPVDGRKNLKVLTGTVKRIVWKNGTAKNAVADGVEYFDPSGKLITLQVKKDVILSASAYRNPLILEASGVGNPKILSKLGVKTVVPLPGVGENMQDHTALGTAYQTRANITGRTILAAMPTAADVLGANFSSVAASTLANLPVWAQQASDYANGAVSAAAFLRRFTVQHDLIFRKNVTIAELFPTNAVTQLVPQLWITTAFSWGSVHLGDVNKINEPVIDSGLLRFEVDYQLLTGATKLSRRAYHSAPLTDLVGAETTPGDAVLPVDAGDEAYKVFLRQNAANAIHVVGSCAMLPKELGGVVDSRVKVHGTKNVRVVDASIIPVQLTGHTAAPVYAVAEKAAAIIKADWS